MQETGQGFNAVFLLNFLVSFLASVAGISPVFADEPFDGAYLSRRFENLKHPVDDQQATGNFDSLLTLPRYSDLARALDMQTSVKAQGSRGTCSIFSATALLESMLVLQEKADNQIDLSEEWLEYLMMRGATGDGSSAPYNFSALAKYGTVSESLLPYIGETWKKITDSKLAEERCGELQGAILTSCLLGHRNPNLIAATEAELTDRSSDLYDPQFLKIRKAATKMKKEFLAMLPGTRAEYSVHTVSAVKELLAAGIPVVLELDFYYGAWNHRQATDLEIGRDPYNWSKGIVGYPEMGSIDRKKSLTEPAGHSILVVGYNDNITVTTKVMMEDGSMQEFKYRGVYYFKNSWGTDSFAADLKLAGFATPGYGVITYKYAHEFGEFFQMPLESEESRE